MNKRNKSVRTSQCKICGEIFELSIKSRSHPVCRKSLCQRKAYGSNLSKEPEIRLAHAVRATKNAIWHLEKIIGKNFNSVDICLETLIATKKRLEKIKNKGIDNG